MKNKKTLFSNFAKEIPDFSLNNYFNLSYFIQFEKKVIRYGGIYKNQKENKNFLLLIELFDDKNTIQEIIKKLKKKKWYFINYQPDFVYIKKSFSKYKGLSYIFNNKIITVLNLVNKNEKDTISFINLIRSSQIFSNRLIINLVYFLPDSINQYELSSIYIWFKLFRYEGAVHRINFVHGNYRIKDKKISVRIHFFCKCFPEKFINNNIFLKSKNIYQYSSVRYEHKVYYYVTLKNPPSDAPFKYHIFHLNKKNKFILELIFEDKMKKNELLSFIDASRKFLDSYNL